jgi:outer membrane lipoprotein SlyB
MGIGLIFGASMSGTPGIGIGGGIAMIIFLPIIYGIVGFIGGVLGAAIYNMISNWIGGFEVEVEDIEKFSE